MLRYPTIPGADTQERRRIELASSPVRASRGVTLIELIAVMSIIGIMAVVAGPRFFSTTTFETQGFISESTAALGYAQKLAVASGCSIRVQFDAGGFLLERWTNPGDCNDRSAPRALVARPGGDQFQSAAPGGVAVSNLVFFFDRIGRPRATGSGTLITNAANLDVTIAAITIQVEPETGFVRRL